MRAHHHGMPQPELPAQSLRHSRVVFLLIGDHEAHGTAFHGLVDQARNLEARDAEARRDLELGLPADEMTMRDRRHQEPAKVALRHVTLSSGLRSEETLR